jgi:hypothetical protein
MNPEHNNQDKKIKKSTFQKSHCIREPALKTIFELSLT